MARIALIVAFTAGLAAPAAHADVAEVVGKVLAPAYADLAASAAALAETAQADCSTVALQPGFNAVWDDWAQVDFFRLGPVETHGRALAMHFWPDAKASGQRAQQALIDSDNPVIDDPVAFADLSVALRGLAGLERLIYPGGVTGKDDVLCRLRRATTADLARMTAEISAEWDAFAAQMVAPGGPGNTAFLTEEEAQQAIFTQIVTGLDYLADTRLARPLGTFAKPRPERAESRLSGRSLRNVAASLQGLRDAALALHPDAPNSRAAFDRAAALIADLQDPALAGVTEPTGWMKVDIISQAITAARKAVQTEIGKALGLSVGFNAKDGD